MAKTKEISRRIKSVNNTKKITKAMEMVAAVKMRKAIEAVIKTRTYANLSWETVWHLLKMSADKEEPLHPLFRPRPSDKRVAIILITSNRGLCGAYNAAVVNRAKEEIARHKWHADFILVGTKGSIIRHHGHNITADFEKSDLITDAREIYPVVRMIMGDYEAKRYDKILVAYTDFINAASQVPQIKQLLPIEIKAEDEYLGVIGADPKLGLTPTGAEQRDRRHLSDAGFTYEYTFEPNPREVLDKMLPRLIEIQLYQAFLEANASEHSARMNAMHQATEAANDMVSELTLFYNKARQAGITAEIAEISAGANALVE